MKLEPGTIFTETAISPPTFAEVEALFDRAQAAGLYGPADRASLPIMFALDPGATLELVEDMHSRIDRCSRCAFLRRTDAGRQLCAGRGVQHEIPRDRGTWCAAFHSPGGAVVILADRPHAADTGRTARFPVARLPEPKRTSRSTR